MNNSLSRSVDERWTSLWVFVVIGTSIGFPPAAVAQDECVPVDIPASEADVIIGGGPQGDVFTVAHAGDVDDDGVADFIIGAPGYSSPDGLDDIGRAYVRSGATLQMILVFTGNEEGDRLGAGVAAAGDIDGDGHDDVLVSAPGAHVKGGQRGIVYVFSGRTGFLLRTYAVGSQLGTRVSNVGDFDGDGQDDHAMFASSGDTVFVYSGADGQLLFQEGGSNGDDFGEAFGGAGDVNNDGFDDLVVGVPRKDAPVSDNGAAYVYSGQNGSVLYEFVGDNVDDQFGSAVGGVGDLDSDGFDDVAVGAPNSDIGGSRSGYVHVFSGRTGQIIYSMIGESTDQLAEQVGTIGDITGDGVADLLIATGRPFGNSPPGQVFLVSGRTGALLRTLTGEVAGDSFAESVAVLDLNMDGVNDLVVAARDAKPDGLAYVFLSPPEGLFEPFDLDQNGTVGVGDLLLLLGQWGERDSCADFDDSGDVGVKDLLVLLANWG